MDIPEFFRTFDKGDHISYINYGNSRSVEYFAAYLAVGLERNELCIFLSYTTSLSEASSYLAQFGVDVEACLDREQLIFRAATGFYLDSGCFSGKRVCSAWEQLIRTAKKKRIFRCQGCCGNGMD